jgi:hypothetical protein
MKCWQGGDFLSLSLQAEQQPQRGLDEFGYRAPLACGHPLELGHDGIVDVESGFHMGNHITDMA